MLPQPLYQNDYIIEKLSSIDCVICQPHYNTKFCFPRKTEFSVRSVRATMSVFPTLERSDSHVSRETFK